MKNETASATGLVTTVTFKSKDTDIKNEIPDASGLDKRLFIIPVLQKLRIHYQALLILTQN